MATRVKAKASDLYERDVYAWSSEQAALLRARRFADLDLEHLILEIEDVGGSLYREVRSQVRTSMEHLKLQHSPAVEPHAGWESTIRTARADIADDLTPSLWPRVEQNLARFYEVARAEASASLRERGEDAAADGLPPTCPYTLDRITGDWLP